MYQFTGKIVGGKFVPSTLKQKLLYDKVIRRMQSDNRTITISIEEVRGVLNESQVKLLHGFIISASDHFDANYQKMFEELEGCMPKVNSSVVKKIEHWNNQELTDFLDKSTAHLLELDNTFNFK